MNPHYQLIALIEAREAQEAFSRAAGWVLLVTHVDTPERVLGLYGPFSEPAAAMAYAAEQERGLNTDDDGGFRCRVHPIMPVT